MRHLLLAKGLWGLVDGTEVLADDMNEQVQAVFQQKTLKAFSTIILAIRSLQLYLVMSCDKSKEAWGELKNHVEHDTSFSLKSNITRWK